jgi:hypothetical protein
MLVVFFPTYLVLTRIVNTIRRTEGGVYLTLTKWLIYISLLIGGAVILGDLVSILVSFLNGELTVRFLLKALSVLLVVGASFTYYALDAKGYWQTHERDSIIYGGVTALIVIIAIVFGFSKIDSPSEVREKNIDNTQITDLQFMQDTIQSYVFTNEKLPQTLEEAYGALDIPTADDTRKAYTYEVTGETTFELCAEFAHETDEYEQRMKSLASPETAPLMIRDPYNWNHNAGFRCFERRIEPKTK